MDKVFEAQTASALREKPRSRHTLMHALMLLATFCWAANIVAAKEVLLGFAPMAVVQLRVLGAAIVFAILFLALRRQLRIRITRREWGTLVLLALSGVTFNQLFFIGGVARTTVAHTGLITALGPVMVLALACLLRMEGLTILKSAGMAVAFAGVALLSFGGAERGSGATWQGDFYCLGASAVFACYAILLKKAADRYDVLTLNTFIYGMGSLLLLPFGLPPVLRANWSAVTSVEAWSLGYMVIFGSVVPYTIFAFAMTDLAASRVAAFSYFQPVIAMTLAIWLLHENPSWRVFAGGALILLGVYLTERERGEVENGDSGFRIEDQNPATSGLER